MRRRRRHLEVSTFPFLAVLLCTMGSLILLLLVLDRRAKMVALHKAHEQAVQLQAARDLARRHSAEQESLTAQQQSELQRRQKQLHDMLAEEEQDLLGKIEQTRGQVAAAQSSLHEEEARADRLKKELESAGVRLMAGKQTLEAQESAAASAARLSESAQRELQKQAAALLQMEQTLAGLKALRERQKNTYSVVPYLGKRGESRRPLYVECAAAQMVFHPDTQALQGPELTDSLIREEVLKRIARQRQQLPQGQGEEAARPYLLMLIRPNGIITYYRAMNALAGLKVDFGYEFIEPDWVLDFSSENGGGAPQPWMTAAKIPSTLPMPPALGPRVLPAMPPLSGSGFETVAGAHALGSADYPVGDARAKATTGPGGIGAGAAGNGNGGAENPASTPNGLPLPGGPSGGVVMGPAVPGLPRFECGSSGGGGGDSIWRSAAAGQGGAGNGQGSGSGGGILNGYRGGPAGNGGGGGMPNGMPDLQAQGGGFGGAGRGSGNASAGQGSGAGATGGNPRDDGLGGSGTGTGGGGNASGGADGRTSGNGGNAPAGPGGRSGTNPGGDANAAAGTVSAKGPDGGGSPGGGSATGSASAPGGTPSGGQAASAGGNGSASGNGTVPRSADGPPPQIGPGGPSGAQGPNDSTPSGANAAGQGNGSSAGGGSSGGAADPAMNGAAQAGAAPPPDAPGASNAVRGGSVPGRPGLTPPQSGEAAGGGSEGAGGSPSILASPLPPVAPRNGSKSTSPPLGRILGNRDWVLLIECHADGILLKYGNKKFALESLATPLSGEHELVAAVRMMIARKQATTEPGEPPYRPIVHFQVWPDGLRAYYRAYPLLQPLGIPTTRENVQP